MMQWQEHDHWDQEVPELNLERYLGTGELRLVNLNYLDLSFPVCKMNIIIPTSQAYYKNQMKMD